MESKPSDLGVPIYLNHKTVFDLLAMMENGFSEFRDVSTLSAETDARKHSVEAGVSTSNVLQFIGLALKGGARRDTERGSSSEGQTTERRTHTPASLFHKLRSRLRDADDSLIKPIENLEDLEALSSGDFVEFRALLRQNPLLDLFESMASLIGLGLRIEAVGSEDAQQQAEAQQAINEMQQAFDQIGLGSLLGETGNGQEDTPVQQVTETPEQQLADQNPMYRMFRIFETALKENGSLEIIGELLDVPDATAVLTTKFEGFEGGDASAIIDGEFRVLGKVVRVIPSNSNGSINLLRKTPFGTFKDEVFEDMVTEMTTQEEGEEEPPIDLPDVKTSIEGPAVLILPMAIFV